MSSVSDPSVSFVSNSVPLGNVKSKFVPQGRVYFSYSSTSILLGVSIVVPDVLNEVFGVSVGFLFYAHCCRIFPSHSGRSIFPFPAKSAVTSSSPFSAPSKFFLHASIVPLGTPNPFQSQLPSVGNSSFQALRGNFDPSPISSRIVCPLRFGTLVPRRTFLVRGYSVASLLMSKLFV